MRGCAQVCLRACACMCAISTLNSSQFRASWTLLCCEKDRAAGCCWKFPACLPSGSSVLEGTPPPIRWSFPMDSWLHVETCYSQISQMWKVDLNLLCLPYSTYYTQGKKIIHIRGRHSYLQEGHSPIMYWDCRTIFSEMFT